MIWMRRIFAVPLAIIFIILTIPIMLIFRVNDTIGNPGFYINQLRQADVYNFVYDSVLPLALEEVKTEGDILSGYVSQLKPHIIPTVKEILPPEWIQAQVEQVISQIFPYTLGDTETIRIDIPLKEPVTAISKAVKNILHKEGMFPSLYDETVSLILDRALASLQGLPLGRDELKKTVYGAFPPEWLLTQIDNALDEVTPYLTGEKEHFTIKVELASRMGDLEIAVANILKRAETYNYLFDNVLAPALKQNAQNLRLPMGVAVTGDEVVVLAKEVFPLPWYRTLVTHVTEQIFAYLKGMGQTLELSVPLTDRKQIASRLLTELVNKKAGMDISALTSPVIDGLLQDVPDQFRLSDAELRQLLGGVGEEGLGKMREVAQLGLTYSDVSLSKSMGEDYETFEDVRHQIARGFVFTEAELRSSIGGSGGGGDLQNFDNMRHLVGLARELLRFLWLIPGFILLFVGLLGGRTWGSKLIWAASVLMIASLIAYIIFVPLFSALVQPFINQAFSQTAAQLQGLPLLMAGRGTAMA